VTYSLGIDVGTTYTGVAVATDGRAEIFPLGHDRPAAPTIVVVRESGEILVGEAAERRALGEAGRVAREFKRRIGDPTPLIVGGTPYGVDALFGHVLRWVYQQVIDRRGGPPTAVTLTHPASWSGFKTEVLRQAARLGGLPAVELLSEPEAAALHNAAEGRVDPGSTVAVYDFGGGTLDIALVRATDAGFEIVGEPEGIERLGGLDFDQAVFAHVDRSLDGMIQSLDTADHSVRSGLVQLRTDCRQAKEALSSDTDTLIPVLVPGLETEVRLTRIEFEAMIRPRIIETIEALRRCVASAALEPKDLDSILLVGGSSRIPLVSQLLVQELGRPVDLDAHPKFTIALGAAARPLQEVGRPPKTIHPTSSLPTPPPPGPVGDSAAPIPIAATSRAEAIDATHAADPHPPRSRPEWMMPSLGAAALIAVGLVIMLILMKGGTETSTIGPTSTTVGPAVASTASPDPADQTDVVTDQTAIVPASTTSKPLPTNTADDVTSVTSSDGMLRIEVPADWTDVDTSPFLLISNPTAHISASASLTDYINTWTEPGITISLVDPNEAGPVDALMASVGSGLGYDTDCFGGQPAGYDDGRVTGLMADWTDCGGTSTMIRVVVGVVDDDPTWLLLAGVQALGTNELATLDHVLATMKILG